MGEYGRWADGTWNPAFAPGVPKMIALSTSQSSQQERKCCIALELSLRKGLYVKDGKGELCLETIRKAHVG